MLNPMIRQDDQFIKQGMCFMFHPDWTKLSIAFTVDAVKGNEVVVTENGCHGGYGEDYSETHKCALKADASGEQYIEVNSSAGRTFTLYATQCVQECANEFIFHDADDLQM